ncbi:MAG: DIP1984 family protein [Desulfuromonas thiophila]|nr:DIP1984 family protein [Desulfuromonas thiophila]
MKLAEALIQRADLQKRLRELEKRLERVALIQEGDTPAEDPQELLSCIEAHYQQLQQLICRINRTNCKPQEDGSCLADLLCQRDMLQKKQALLRTIAAAGSLTAQRHSGREVRFICTVPVAQLQKQADECALAYREIDTRIQRLNWSCDLLAD